jgi:ABC-type branched-subunit amino acid transport system substrate-binding protein
MIFVNKNMGGIPHELHSKLSVVLSKCEQFYTNQELQSFFKGHRQLSCWADSLPQPNNTQQRVIQVMSFLVDKYRIDTNENGLVILVRLLCSSFKPPDSRHSALSQLEKELNKQLNIVELEKERNKQPNIVDNKISFNWLHLTDFHQVIKEQDGGLSRAKEIFFKDLNRLHEKSGPWDLVLFTGDLTQEGSAEEFEKLDQLLEQLWANFQKLGSSPKLLAIPGNHDLVRPNKKKPAVILLQRWSEEPEVRREFWKNPESEYRKVMDNAFANYMAWWKRQPWKPKNLKAGILPGDFSATIEKNSAKLGILGLNTSFLQLIGKNDEGKLDIDTIHTCQFHQACDDNNTQNWARKHRACLLLTHHRPGCLTVDARMHLNTKITAGYPFVLYLRDHTDTKAKQIWHDYTVNKIELELELELIKGKGKLKSWFLEASREGGKIQEGEISIFNDRLNSIPSRPPVGKEKLIGDEPGLIQNLTRWITLFLPQNLTGWIIPFLLILLIPIDIFSIYRWLIYLPRHESLGDNISIGEEILVESSEPLEKENGVKEVQDCQKFWNHFQAIWKNNTKIQNCFAGVANTFKESWDTEGKDPETLIYINNAFLEHIKADPYTIAVVVPVRDQNEQVNGELAKEILRGVAQAQTEVNLSLFKKKQFSFLPFPNVDLKAKRFNGKGLKVIIANDANSEDGAKNIAKKIVGRPEILVVVGHWASKMTMATKDIYDDAKLVMVSPGTSTSKLTAEEWVDVFFRTTTTTIEEAEKMVNSLLNKNQTRVVFFYNPNSQYSADLKKQFEEKFEEKFEGQGEIINLSLNMNYFAEDNFNVKNAINEARRKAGDQEFAIVLISDGQVSDAFDNSLKIIEENGGQNWIVANSSVYSPRTLEIAQDQSQEERYQLLKKLILIVPEHPLNNSDFFDTAVKLWEGYVSARTVLSYDAMQVIIQGIQEQGTRPTSKGIQKTLADENFIAQGATGEIKFKSGTGDRQKVTLDSIRVYPCPSQPFGFMFIPDKFSTPEEAKEKCSMLEF